MRALPRHRRHGRHLRIQTDRTGGRQLHHIGVRAAGRSQRRRARTKIKVHCPAKQAHDIHLADRVDRQPVPAVVGGSAPALRPHCVAASSQLDQKRVLAPFRSCRVRRARARVQIHRAAERAEQVHAARGVQRHRLHVVASGSTQLPTPHVATIRIQAHDKAVIFPARGQRRRARSGVEVRRAAETARHGRVSVSAHRQAVAEHTAFATQALARAHRTLRIESDQGRRHPRLRHEPSRTERGIEVRHTRQGREQRINPARRIEAEAAHEGHRMIADRRQRLRPNEVTRRGKFCHKAVGQPPGAHGHNVRAGIEIHRAVEEAAQVYVAHTVNRHSRRLFMRRAAQRLGPDQFARRRQLQQKQIGRAARSQRALAGARIEIHLPRKRARQIKVARGVRRQRAHFLRPQTADTLRPQQTTLRIQLRDKNIPPARRCQARHPGTRIEVHGPTKGARSRHISERVHRHDGTLIASARSVGACPGKGDVPGHA